MSDAANARSVGATPPRPDGPAKVTGRAEYVDDLEVAGLWFGATVRSPHCAADIVRIDASRACEDPDVVVVTAADLPGPNVLMVIADDWPVLADERVNHAQEPVALVAAPTRERARRAAARVVVEYVPREPVIGIDAALAAKTRLLAECKITHGDVAAGLAGAAHVIEGTYETGLQEHIYIEPQGMIAIPQTGGGVEIVGSMQCPFYIQNALCTLLGLEPEQCRVRQATTGGGFGGKEEYPDIIAAHAALLALASGRPVKIVYERHEDILATTKRHPSRVRHRTGVDADGKLLAVEVDVVLDGGAYVTLSPVVLSRAVLHAAGPYACANVAIRGRVVETNSVPSGAFRGFGAPQTQFASERQMDKIARVVGVDPLAIRERNAYREGDITPTAQVLDSGVSALDCLRTAAERTDFRKRWAELEAERRSGGDPPARRGIGLSLYWHGSGFTGNGEQMMRSPVRLRLARSGLVEIRVSSTDFGQGTSIVLAQVVADAIGIPLDRVSVIVPDTAEVPNSGPTVASRTVMIVGGVLEKAAAELAEQVRRHAPGADFDEAARCYLDEVGELVVEKRYEPPAGGGFDEETYTGTAYPAYGFGCDIVEIEVDLDTLVVTPERATLVCDVGRAIHPVLCRGQVEGGTLQAFGQAYLEELGVDDDGHWRNDRLSTYIIPTTLDTPAMDTVLLEYPARGGPQGAKGVGELPADGGAPALVAAIENATGISPVAVPATPERLLAALEGGRTVAGD